MSRMSDSGSRSPRATVRKILSMEKKQAEVENPNELCDLRDFSLDEVHSPRGKQYDPPDLREPHERTLTDRGRAYQLEVRALKKQEVETKLRKHVGRIYSLLESHPGIEELEKEREILDLIKEEFNQAYRSYDELLYDESAKGAAYRYFDLCDREFTECRMRLTEILHSIEQRKHEEFESKRQETKSNKSSRSGRTKVSGSSRASRSSVMSKRVEAAAKAAKLKVEMKYLDHETNLRRIQLEREIALADAEEEAIKLVMDEEGKNGLARKDAKLDERFEDSFREARFDVEKTAIKHKPLLLKPEALPFAPLTPPIREAANQERDEPSTPQDATLKQIVNLQAKQTELSAIIVNQQRASTLPSQEPPVFNGSYFDYPTFIAAFDAMIDKKVDSEKDKLYFLSKYTTNKAHEVVKGFLTWESDKGYKEARKLLAQRFGNPFRVAEAYKAKLRNWPQIVEGDSSSLQDFSDFLARCEGAMQSMKYMEELNSTRLLQEISKKLPLKSGSRWCRQAHDVLKKTERTVSFHDLVEFVREEADLANDPVFSPEALKGDRDKVPDRSRVKRSQGANSFVSFSSRTPPSESRGRSNAEQKPKQQSSCIFCGGNHLPHKCGELSRKSIDERLALVRSKGLCFGCLKRGHQSKNCRARLNCEKCGKQHPTPLHDPTYKERSVNQNTPESSRSDSAHSHQASSEVANDDRDSNLNVSVCSAISGRDMVPNSLIIPVYVFRKGHPELKVKVYALLDDASDTTFIKTVVKDKLGIPGVNSKLILSTMLGSEEITVRRVDGLVVERIDQRVQVELPSTYSRDQRPDTIQKRPNS